MSLQEIADGIKKWYEDDDELIEIDDCKYFQQLLSLAAQEKEHHLEVRIENLERRIDNLEIRVDEEEYRLYQQVGERIRAIA